MTQTTTMDGRTVDFVVRWERGTIDRFIYSIAMLAPLGEARRSPRARHSAWNRAPDLQVRRRRRDRPRPGTDAQRRLAATTRRPRTRLRDHALHRHRTEHALQPRARRRDRADGEGALRRAATACRSTRSGSAAPAAAIQQYVYGQNHPGLIDAAIPQYSYPDMVTQTIHVGDCELLENYMDVTRRGQRQVAELEQPRAG